MGYRVGVDPPVREVAEIELDGEPCGLLWRPPYRLDLGDRLEPGEHRLRITVHGTTAPAVAADSHASARIARRGPAPPCPRDRIWKRLRPRDQRSHGARSEIAARPAGVALPACAPHDGRTHGHDPSRRGEEDAMAITLREVATRAGVSVATASRALHRPEMVQAATRDAVQRAAAELGYAPNRSARTLITGRTGVLGVVVPDLLNPFYPAVLKGAQARARHHGVQLLLADAEETPEGELPLVRTLASQVDGVLLCSPRMDAASLDAASRLTRIALVNRTHYALEAVSADACTGVRAALRHLRALGHRRVGVVGGPASSWSDAERRRAIGEVAAELELQVVDVGSFAPTTAGGREAAEALLVAELAAVMVYNDVMALGLIAQLRASGFRVPGDVSVVGWDDIEFAAVTDPALSTVTVPRYEMGAAGIDALVGEPAAPEDRGMQWRFETGFVPRGTTSRAPR